MSTLQNYLTGQRDKLLTNVLERKYPHIRMDQLLTRNDELTWADSVGREAIDVASTKDGAHRGSDGAGSSLNSSQEFYKVESNTAEINFTLQEIQQGMEFGKDLKARFAIAKYSQAVWEVNKIALIGTANKSGLYSHASANKTTAAWSTLLAAADTNPQALLDALSGGIESAKAGIGYTADVDSIIFPDLTKIRMTMLGASGNKSLFSVIQEAFPGVQILEDSLLKGAGTGGVDRVVVSTAQSDHVAENIVTQPPMFTDLVQIGAAKYQMACLYSTAGCLLHQPKGVSYIDGNV